jgi:hypothetical protein
MNIDTLYLDGAPRSWPEAFADLWAQYRGAAMPASIPLAERMDMLQNSLRCCLRMEFESYLAGRATAALVTETSADAILPGKIRRGLEN